MTGLLVMESAIEGRGCYAARSFEPGEIVGEYTGERITDDEAERRYAHEEKTYLFLLDSGMCIDAMHDPNPIKYINHCCEPNCESIERDDRIFIRAVKPIKPGEELTYDYSLESDDDDPLPCACGSKNCRGTMREEL